MSTRWWREPPLVVDDAFLREHRIDLVVHGDDLTAEAAQAVYGAAVARGVLHLLPRRGTLSTTELIRRVRERPDLG